ncbi:MAG: acyl-CoA desaturase [Actinobacteria bacterium]|nr:acyl-CoA desaturase [Actinomycetota bacterium]
MLRVQRSLEIAGRVMFYGGWLPPLWIGAVAALSASKILDNMEIGHNVMHGQYDWAGIPELSGARFEWDTVSPAAHWKHSHNHLHHTYTNILDKDRDIGYALLRIAPEQRWTPQHLFNPLLAAILAVGFEWGVMLHELEIERIIDGERSWAETRQIRREMGAKAGRQILKDYVVFPALTGPLAPLTFLGNLASNVVRNVWAFTIIFCGHFPDGTRIAFPDDTENETRGQWYLRQITGSANIEGGALFHIMSGNLSHQIEHHLFPDLPAHRYPEIAPRVRAICERHGVPYNTGGLARQFGSVVRKIFRYSVPW